LVAPTSLRAIGLATEGWRGGRQRRDRIATRLSGLGGVVRAVYDHVGYGSELHCCRS
jgi:hypothetical protein